MVVKDMFSRFASVGHTSSDSKELRDAGDRLRDAREFGEAAKAYEKYLAFEPDDFDIWVQRGNCLKDAKEFLAAQMCYNTALSIKPNNADLHLQLGHLIKLQGDRREAILRYKKAYELDPGLAAAAFELANLGVKTKASESLLYSGERREGPVKILDITDLLSFLDVHNRVTGIQRVQSAIIYELFKGRLAAGAESRETILAYCDQENQTVYGLSARDVYALIDLVQCTDAHSDDIKTHLERIYATKTKISFIKGDVYIILGAFWIGDDYSGTLLALKRVGVKIGVYIYDLIPLTHPQFVTESTRQDVLDKFADIMSLTDFALTISSYVAKEVKSVMRSELSRTIPVLPVPLAHALPEQGEADDEVDEDFETSLPKEFVLCVCTLEGRKNHLLLLNTWASLNRKHSGEIPNLILVGKWGWRIEEFRQQLEAQRYVNDKILVLGNLSDAQLKHLYDRCLFTVFPSFVEGWGLPVGESLAHGRPCIASNTSSIPEVGGDFVRYIDPYDPLGAADVIERALMDRKGLDAWAEHIRTGFKIRTWGDVATDFLDKSDRALAEIKNQTPAPPVTLEPGQLYYLNQSKVLGHVGASWSRRAIKFVCAAGWRALETWGSWSLRRNATLEFGTNLPPGVKIRTLVTLRLPPPTDSGPLTIRDWKGKSKTVHLDSGPGKWVEVVTETDELGRVSLQVERPGAVDQVDQNRPLYFGIEMIAYHQCDDTLSRIALVERLVLGIED